jgi:5-methylcytosine-specific restriction endonuclease McrA
MAQAAVLKERSRRPESLRTLILNADGYPLATWPLSIVTAREAIEKLWLDRAYVVETWEDAFFHSPSTTIAVPKAMMLREFAKTGNTPKFCRASIYLRDRYICQYCGERFERPDLTFDHVVPRSRGGRTVWENIVSSCIPCNARKDQRTIRESGMTPLAWPRQPTTMELRRAGLELLPNDVRDDFGSWLYWNTELKA